MSEYVSLNTIFENPLEEFKKELKTLGIFDDINEGEEVYKGEGTSAMVFPGPDIITHPGLQQLQHLMTIYVIFMHGASETAKKDLRLAGELAYDALMVDQKHNNSCWECLPLSWMPGFMKQDDLDFVGIRSIWNPRNYQTFPLSTDIGTEYTTMKDIIENIVTKFKSEISEVDGIDKINEGEEVYEEGVIACVIPGESRITSFGRSKLQHTYTIRQLLFASSAYSTFAKMRKIGEDIYDRLMEDPSHGGICNICVPTRWHPGFMKFGEQNFVGIEATWEAILLQRYTST